jgi:hypothetical protein
MTKCANAFFSFRNGVITVDRTSLYKEAWKQAWSAVRRVHLVCPGTESHWHQYIDGIWVKIEDPDSSYPTPTLILPNLENTPEIKLGKRRAFYNDNDWLVGKLAAGLVDLWWLQFVERESIPEAVAQEGWDQYMSPIMTLKIDRNLARSKYLPRLKELTGTPAMITRRLAGAKYLVITKNRVGWLRDVGNVSRQLTTNWKCTY